MRIRDWSSDVCSSDLFPAQLDDALMMEGFTNSIWIGLGVVCVSVPIGLAAAIVMTQVHRRVQAFYYTIVVSSVLLPGGIIGISTGRSEERRLGEEWGRKGKSRWSAINEKKKQQ